MGLFVASLAAVWPCSLNGAARSVDRTAQFHPIDLSRFYTGSFSNSAPSDLWNGVPRGLQTFEGVPFQIEGRIELTGMLDARDGDFFPPRVTGIPVGRKARRLFLLHGAIFSDDDAVPIAKLVLHYARGQERSLRLAYGIHVRNSFRGRSEKKSELADPNSSVAWSQQSDDTERPIITMRLFKTAFDNPLPDEEITSIDLISYFSRVTPVMVGLTVAGGNESPSRPARAGRSMRKATEWSDGVYRGEFVLRAIDAANGTVLTNATASLMLTDDRYSFFFGTNAANADGRIVLEYPPQQTVAFNIHVRAPGYIPVTRRGARAELREFPHDLEVKLEHGVEIGGRITDEAGRPLAGAAVTVSKVTPGGPKRYWQIDYGTAVADADGRWSTHSVPADFSELTFELRHPEYRPVNYLQAGTNSAPKTLPRETLLAGNAAMAMQPAIHVSGVVTEEGGPPVPKAELFVFDNANNPETRRTLRTDDQGRFSFFTPTPGDGAIAVLAKGRAPKFQPVSFEPGMPPVDLAMRKGNNLTIVVRDSEQQPVVGARVRADRWHDTSLLRWQGRSDAEGHALWEDAPEDSVMYYVTATNYYSTRMMTGTSGGEVMLQLRRMSMASGRVVDAETKKPIDEFNVIRGHSYSPNEPMRWERYNVNKGQFGEYSIRLNDYGSGEGKILIEAQDYLPAASKAFSKPGWYTNNFELRRGKGISGVVQLANGQPAANCSVVLTEKGDSAFMDREAEFRSTSSGGEVVRTDPQGRFEFPAKFEADTIFAANESGYAEIDADKVAATGKVGLAPWGRIQGAFRVGPKLEPNQSIMLETFYSRYGTTGGRSRPLALYLHADLDPSGNFIFARVPPGERMVVLQCRFGDERRMSTVWSHGVPVLVKAGETSEVTLGGTGRQVIGHMQVNGGPGTEVDWLRDPHSINLHLPEPPNLKPPDVSKAKNDEERQKLWNAYNEKQRQFWQTDEGMALQRQQRSYVLMFDTNANFRIESVPPGTYDLSMNVSEPIDEYNTRQIGNLYKQVVIPPAPADRPNEPFDLGAIDMVLRRNLRIGQPAPSFEAKTLDGKPLKLEDYRGKHVLLSFYGTWTPGHANELQILKGLHDMYSKDNKLAIIGLSIGNGANEEESFTRTNGMKWTQCYLGAWSETQVPALFGVEGLPHTILIDPQGKVLGRNLRGSSMRTAVRNALAASARASKN
jgi:peroxiredoxin